MRHGDRSGELSFEKADRRRLALWAADCAEHALVYFERCHPRDHRPRDAVEAGRAWARGEISVSDARRAALAAQAAARKATHPAARAAARAAGHAAATAHVAGHAPHAAAYAVRAVAAAVAAPDGLDVTELESEGPAERVAVSRSAPEPQTGSCE